MRRRQGGHHDRVTMDRGPAITTTALLVTACGADGGAGPAAVAPDFPMTVSDCGRPLTLPDRPRRILTMSSTSSTLMWAAGAAEKITTRSYESVSDLGPAQQALANVPLASNDIDLSLETILEQRPDLVITAGLNITTPQDLAAGRRIVRANQGARPVWRGEGDARTPGAATGGDAGPLRRPQATIAAGAPRFTPGDGASWLSTTTGTGTAVTRTTDPAGQHHDGSLHRCD